MRSAQRLALPGPRPGRTAALCTATLPGADAVLRMYNETLTRLSARSYDPDQPLREMGFGEHVLLASPRSFGSAAMTAFLNEVVVPGLLAGATAGVVIARATLRIRN